MSDILVTQRDWNLRTLGWMVFAALVLRVAFLIYILTVNPSDLFVDDSISYIEPARGLLETGGFLVDGRPDIVRTPGYPLFLAPFLAVFGANWAPIVVCVQIVLLFGIAFLTYRMVQLSPFDHIPTGAPELAFVIILFEPNLFLMEFTIRTETLFVFILTLGVLLLGRGLQGNSGLAAAGGLLTITAAAFVRPIALYLPYLIVIVFGSYYLFRSSGQRRWTMILSLCGALLAHHVAIGAWEDRNEDHYGVETFSTIAQLNIHEYVGAAVLARAEGRNWQEVRREFVREKKTWKLNAAEKAERGAEIGLEIVMDHPLDAARIGMRGLAVNMFDPGTGDLANVLKLREEGSGLIYRFNNLSPPAFVAYLLKNEKALLAFLGLGLLWILVMWGGACWALWQYRASAGRFAALLLLTGAYLIVVSAGPQSWSRFRAPATPAIVVFTSIGLLSMRTQLGPYTNRIRRKFLTD